MKNEMAIPILTNEIIAHMAVLAGTDFFTVEVLTWRGLVTYYILFFLHLETRRDTLAGITRHPIESWILRWRATLLMRRAAASSGVTTCCMIATPNSATPSIRFWPQRASDV
jgi:hypothetical protein